MLPIPVPLPGIPLRLIAFAVLAAALAGAGWYVKGAISERAELRTQVAAANAAIEDYQRRAHESFRLAERRSQDAERIRTITKETIREVRVRIPVDACPLPDEWRVLHNAAAEGVSAPAPGGPDAAPSSPQEAAEVVTDNYGTYHDIADRLRKLQEWVRGNLK